jgi:hypothetical protein
MVAFRPCETVSGACDCLRRVSPPIDYERVFTCGAKSIFILEAVRTKFVELLNRTSDGCFSEIGKAHGDALDLMGFELLCWISNRVAPRWFG